MRFRGNAIGYDRVVLTASLNLAEMEFDLGNTQAAIEIAGEALAGFKKSRDAGAVDNQLVNLLAYLVVGEDIAAALPIARETLHALRQRPRPIFVAFFAQHVAMLAAMCQHPHDGARLLGFADSAIEMLGSTRERTEQREYDLLVARLQQQLTAPELEALTAAGRSLTNEESLDLETSILDAVQSLRS